MSWHVFQWGRRLDDQEMEALETSLEANLFEVSARPEFTRRLHDYLVNSPEVEADWVVPAVRRRQLFMVAAGAFSAVVLVLLGVRTIAWAFGAAGRRAR